LISLLSCQEKTGSNTSSHKFGHQVVECMGGVVLYHLYDHNQTCHTFFPYIHNSTTCILFQFFNYLICAREWLEIVETRTRCGHHGASGEHGHAHHGQITFIVHSITSSISMCCFFIDILSWCANLTST
jgi:hypothetical protein